jgi:hypothetical protein
MRFLLTCFALSLLAFAPAAICQNLGFDLAGPPVDVKVERKGKTLPIAEVPSLQAGDRLWVHPNFPDSQSVHYLLIVAFLRGSTNPPPTDWFTKAETWDKAVREEGIFVTVPPEAQQAMIFLAPQATGDFSTLRSAVRGRPGAFVRSSQDLQQASLDRARLERYLDEIKKISDKDPKDLQQKSVVVAHNLKIKVDEKCFDKPLEQQYACLTQNSDQLILDDANTQSMLARVSNGATADLMNQISYSRLGGGGAYSAYVGAIIDFGRIMGSLHNAAYQYIPALAVPRNDSLSLRLNNPPSFRKPQSVLVVALPPVQKSSAPSMHAPENGEPYCLASPSPVLAAEGTPLLFATHFAHDLFLRLQDSSGKKIEVPAVADPVRGGFAIETKGLHWQDFNADVTGTIHGEWGFDTFEGPQFKLHIPHPEHWNVASGDKTALVVGREDVLHVSAESACCVSNVALIEDGGKPKPLTWKATKTQDLEIKVPLEGRKPGPVTLTVSQHGRAKPDEIATEAYAEAAQFDRFTLNAGDAQGTLEGKRLDEVKELNVDGVRFAPAELKRRSDHDELTLTTQGNTDQLQQAQASAKVVLHDGRESKLPATILAPRPKVTLLSKGVQSDDVDAAAIHIGDGNELPTTGRIVFSIKSVVPAEFPRGEVIQVAAPDNSFHTDLKMSDGSLVLQDAQTALGMIDPAKAFGSSAFGPLRFRPMSADGTAGDWQPLGTLVRLPVLKEVSCPAAMPKACLLSGTNLFLLSAVSADDSFENATMVPDGFTGQTLPITRPAGKSVYFKLRDDPAVVQSASVPTVRETATAVSKQRVSAAAETDRASQ